MLPFGLDAHLGQHVRHLAVHQVFADALPPMNAGQVYTTLARLERDGLVQGARIEEDKRDKREAQQALASR